MSRTARTATLSLLAGIFLLTTLSLSAAPSTWKDFAAASTRADDALVLQALDGADLETSIQLCEGLGLRVDPYAGDIIEALVSRYQGAAPKARSPSAAAARTEYLLRVLLSGLFDPARGETALRERVQANAGAIAVLLSEITALYDFQLVGVLASVLPYMTGDAAGPALMLVGGRLVLDLQRGLGLIPSQEIALAFDYLSSVQKMHVADFLDQVASIARLSREKVLVDRAREVAASLE